MWYFIISYLVPCILLVLIGYLSWLFTDSSKIIGLSLPAKYNGIKKVMIIYSRYLYSGGVFRRVLFILVVISLAYVLLFKTSEYKFLENMAFSIIAAFIFDTFINFQKEHLQKCMVSRHWHSDYYSCYNREKVVLAALCGERALPSKFKLASMSKIMFKAIFHPHDFLTTKAISLPWSSDGKGMKMMSLPKGFMYGELILGFIREDAKFINGFYLDEKITSSFPGMNEISQRFNNSCLITLSMIETKLGIEKGWNGSNTTICEQMQRYLVDRREFMNYCEKHMGHYGITGM
jgi:hypothetical protein